MIRGFKGFRKDMTCQGFQYEAGKTFEMTDKPILCQQGFHFCENPLDVFTYYAPGDNRYCEAEGDGITAEHDDVDGDSKVATQKIRIGAEIGLKGMIEAGVKFIFEKSSSSKDTQTTTGYRANAATTGDDANAATTGYGANAATTGYRANAATTGDRANAATTGDRANAATTGYRANAATTGDGANAATTGYGANAATTGYGANAATTGDRANAATTGDRANAATTGDGANAATTGDGANAATTGDRANASALGKHAIAAALGIKSQAKAALGNWLVLSEWSCHNDWNWVIKGVQAVKVDGETIKADTYYRLVDGKVEEASSDEA